MADGSEGTERRQKRKCVTRKTAVPSATHYVGYVEDGETPEMIMRKFEELERVMAHVKQSKSKASAAATPPPEEVNIAANDAKAGPSSKLGANLDGTSPHAHAPCSQHTHNASRSAGAQTATAAVSNSCGANGAMAGLSNGIHDEEGLSEEALLEVFKHTSIFNVRAALDDNDILLDEEQDAEAGVWTDDGAWSGGSDGEPRGFWSEDEAWEAGGRRGSRRSGRPPRPPRSGGGVSAVPRTSREKQPRHQVVTQFNSETGTLIRRHVRCSTVPRDEVYKMVVPPPPIPLSWGRNVAAYDPNPPQPPTPAEQPDLRLSCSYIETADMQDTLSVAPTSKRSFQAILINSGWESSVPPPIRINATAAVRSKRSDAPPPATLAAIADGAAFCKRLHSLPIPRLCPIGFVFIWAEKGAIHPIMRQLYEWGYIYIENLTWVQLQPNNAIACEPSGGPFRRSHMTLLIFRKDGEGKDIELRHQRSPDVIFDVLRAANGRQYQIPPEVYITIETMLPTGFGSFLELWAEQGVRRAGWTHLAELTDDAQRGGHHESVNDQGQRWRSH